MVTMAYNDAWTGYEDIRSLNLSGSSMEKGTGSHSCSKRSLEVGNHNT